MNKSTLFALVFPLVASTGCATIIRGEKQDVRIETAPEGATVKVDNNTYTSPAKLELSRKDDHQVAISHPDYRTVEFTLNPEWDGLSLITDFPIPGGEALMVIDNSTGADKTFGELARIHLTPTTNPSDPPLKMKNYRGTLVTEERYSQLQALAQNDKSKFFNAQNDTTP
jgi:hypothetical protein